MHLETAMGQCASIGGSKGGGVRGGHSAPYTTLYIGGAPCSVLRANELMTGLLIMGCTTISEK